MSVDILNFYSQIDIYKDPALINTSISDKEIKQHIIPQYLSTIFYFVKYFMYTVTLTS